MQPIRLYFNEALGYASSTETYMRDHHGPVGSEQHDAHVGEIERDYCGPGIADLMRLHGDYDDAVLQSDLYLSEAEWPSTSVVTDSCTA